MKKILITGNSGYIGSHLTQILNQRRDLKLYGFDRNQPIVPIVNFSQEDLTYSQQWQIEKEHIEFDCVIHLAAEVAVGRSVFDPTLYYLTNTFGTFNLLQKIKTKNFVCASTGAAAGLGSPYGISKRAMEDIVKQYCTENNIPYTIFRFYNVTGSDGIPPTNPDGLMWNLIKAQKTGEFNLFGVDYNTPDGTCLRDYTHVNEICHALVKAIDTTTNQIENLGHGVGTSVQEMIDIYKRVNNCDFRVNVCPRREGDLERSVLDNPSPFMQKLYNLEDLLRVNSDI